MEEWRNIEGFGGFYQVSNTGKIRSMGQKQHRGKGEWFMRSLSKTHDGYLKIRLVANGRDVTQRVHTLVARAFIPNPNGFETVNHKDGDKTNNNVDNLEWADRHYQMRHAYKHGLKKPVAGTMNGNAKVSADDVRYIRTHYKRNSKEFGTVALGRRFGLTNVAVGRIVRGVAYKNVK